MMTAPLWPLVHRFVATHDVAGLAIAIVHGDAVETRCFGCATSGPASR